MNVALIVAAGIGKRMGLVGGKQFLPLAGKPLLAHTLSLFEQASLIDAIIIITTDDGFDRCLKIIDEYGILKADKVVIGGAERQDSVYNGLMAASDFEKVETVVVHDGARPLIEPLLIDDAIMNLNGYDGVVVGIPAKDTVKLVRDGVVSQTLKREEVWQIQTPQVFRQDILLQAHEKAKAEAFYGTDDAALVERNGGKVKVILGSDENIKVTTPADLITAEAILKSREAGKRV